MKVLELSADYKYDAWGNRVEKSVDADGAGAGAAVATRFAYDGWNPAKGDALGTSEFDVWADLDGSSSLTTRYVRGDQVDRLFARLTSSDVNRWYLVDHQGSVRNIVDNAGASKDALAYDAFGNIVSESNSAERGRYAWTSREIDTETGHQYNRARYYDATTGRWISQDPLGFDAGDSNLYRYASNSHLTHIDPSGLQPPATQSPTPYLDYLDRKSRYPGTFPLADFYNGDIKLAFVHPFKIDVETFSGALNSASDLGLNGVGIQVKGSCLVVPTLGNGYKDQITVTMRTASALESAMDKKVRQFPFVLEAQYKATNPDGSPLAAANFEVFPGRSANLDAALWLGRQTTLNLGTGFQGPYASLALSGDKAVTFGGIEDSPEGARAFLGVSQIIPVTNGFAVFHSVTSSVTIGGKTHLRGSFSLGAMFGNSVFWWQRKPRLYPRASR